jgi:hypothetical protein
MTLLAERVNSNAELASIPLCSDELHRIGESTPALSTPVAVVVTVVAAAYVAGYAAGYHAAGVPGGGGGPA